MIDRTRRAFGALTLGICLAVLGACALTPTQESTAAVLINAAVATTVQHGSQDPGTWTLRATKIKAIAVQLKTLDSGAIADLPALTAALRPLIAAAGLNPADVVLANLLISSLDTLITQYVSTHQNATTQTAIQLVLNDVISACGAYGAT